MTQPLSWLQFGENHRLQIIVIEPLFEEANRCRRLIAEVMRGLDRGGVGSRLANLPGTGESAVDVADVRLTDWHAAVAAHVPALIASFRGGALIDGAAARGVWRLSPETGDRIVRDLKRATLASADSTLYAGHALSSGFLADLESASLPAHPNVRTVRLETEAADADLKIAGSPLWRRAEPGEDPALAAAIVSDLVDWAKRCAG